MRRTMLKHYFGAVLCFILLSRFTPSCTFLFGGVFPKGPRAVGRTGSARAAPGASSSVAVASRRAGRRRGRVARASAEVALLESVDAWFTTQPYQSAFFVASIKATASDILAQKSEQIEQDKGTTEALGEARATGNPLDKATESTSDDISWRRTLAFFLYGGLYQGCVQYFIFNECYPVWFGNGEDVTTVAEKVLFDQFVLTPFLCLPVAYVIKALAFNNGPPEGLRRYVKDAENDLLIKYWLLWGPVQCLTFGVVPAQWRIPFIAFVSFFWLFVLSTISSRGDATSGRSGDLERPARAVTEP